MAERCLYTAEVAGSIPVPPTNSTLAHGLLDLIYSPILHRLDFSLIMNEWAICPRSKKFSGPSFS